MTTGTGNRENDTQQLFRQMPCGLLVLDGQGRIAQANPWAASLLGFAPEAPPSDTLDRLLARDKGTPAEVTALFAAAQGEERTVKVALPNRTLQLTGRLLAPGGKGERPGTVVLVLDISLEEQRQLAERRRERYAVMGELSADIAHEFRNPLGSINLLASLLRKESKRQKDVHRAEQILAAVRNMENKISSLIQFSKIYQIPVRPVNLHAILKEILQISEAAAHRELAFLSARFTAVDPVVECNPDMIKQVFLTLILNTLQSLPPSGRLEIETRQVAEKRQVEVHFIERAHEAQGAAQAEVTNRFGSGKEPHWGLGLAIIHNIINLYRGTLHLEVLQNAGTAIVLSFPLPAGGNPPAPVTPP